ELAHTANSAEECGLWSAYNVWANSISGGSSEYLVSNRDDMLGAFGAYTRAVTRSSNNLDILNNSPHPIETGDRVQFTTTTTLPSPLTTSTDYYAIRVDDDSFRVATSLSNAISGTNVALTDAGTGTHTVTVMRGIWANSNR